jgi:cbb3-type cytochrome oxidase subunit 3
MDSYLLAAFIIFFVLVCLYQWETTKSKKNQELARLTKIANMEPMDENEVEPEAPFDNSRLDRYQDQYYSKRFENHLDLDSKNNWNFF